MNKSNPWAPQCLVPKAISRGQFAESHMNNNYTISKYGLTFLERGWTIRQLGQRKCSKKIHFGLLTDTHSTIGSRISPFLAAWVSVPPLPLSQHLGTEAQAQAQVSKAHLAASGHLQSRKGRVKQSGFLLRAASGIPINL